MTEKEYRNHPAVSRSELFKITESPEKFKFYKDNPPEPTPALIFGQAFHKLVLEPESFNEEFAVIPVCDRRTTQGKELFLEFLETSENKILITQDEYIQATEMRDSILNNPLAVKLLNGEREKPFFWTDEMTGEECKCRVDCIPRINGMNILVDVKSAGQADTESFMKDSIRYGYDFQSAMYSEGVKANTGKEWSFVFLVVEKEPPYAINILQADPIFVRRGYDTFRELIGIYHDCKTTGNWYGYLGKFDMINNLSLPSWLAKEIE